jgi:predicted phosphatase
MTLWILFDVISPNCKIRNEALDLAKRQGIKEALEWTRKNGGNVQMTEHWELPEKCVNPLAIIKRIDSK